MGWAMPKMKSMGQSWVGLGPGFSPSGQTGLETGFELFEDP